MWLTGFCRLASGSEGRWFKSKLRAELSCMSKCPWARYWTPNCSWCAVGTCHQWGPCDELATCPGCTLPSPRDSWDWLQQKPLRPHKRDKVVTDNGWMDGWMDLSLSFRRGYGVYLFISLMFKKHHPLVMYKWPSQMGAQTLPYESLAPIGSHITSTLTIQTHCF